MLIPDSLFFFANSTINITSGAGSKIVDGIVRLSNCATRNKKTNLTRF